VPYDDLTGTIARKICMACSREFTGVTAHCPHDGNMLVMLPQDNWEGKRLADKYKIERRLGTGGMGVVYLAWHELMDRWVAIKMLKQSFVEDSLSMKRFQQEAKAASRLKHPNVITLHDFGITNTGQPYMVMDYLVSTHPDPSHVARSLAQEIKELGQMPVERCIHIIAQACEALDHAHRQGVIHRDVKPANIMIVPCEEDADYVKVVDFGVAKLLPINSNREEDQGLTQVGELCGSPLYMSPEQCMGQALDPRADIYSMGVVLFEALTGKLPLVGKNMVETMSKHMNEAAPTFKQTRPDLFIPDKVEAVVRQALEKEPHKRQQTMAQLAQDLQFSIPRPGQTPSLKTIELMSLQEEEPKRSGWILPAIVAGGVAAATTGTIFLFAMKHDAVPAATTSPPPGAQHSVNPATTAGAVNAAATAEPAGISSKTNTSTAATTSTPTLPASAAATNDGSHPSNASSSGIDGRAAGTAHDEAGNNPSTTVPSTATNITPQPPATGQAPRVVHKPPVPKHLAPSRPAPAAAPARTLSSDFAKRQFDELMRSKSTFR
jgi:serine/threonine-protein kinase